MRCSGPRLRRVLGNILSSHWGPPAALLAWGALAGLVFAVWLAPPGAPRRPPPVRAPADSRPADPPPEAPAAVSAHLDTAPRQDAAADAARVAAAVARWRVAPSPAVHAYAHARDERPAATQLSAGAQAAAQPASVLIRHRDGSAAGREAAKRVAEEARRAGVAVVGIRAAPLPTA